MFAIRIALHLMYGCSSDEEKKVAHYEKGVSYFNKGEYKSAELEFKNAAQIDPEYIDAYAKLGETYLKLGHSQRAYRTYSRALHSMRIIRMPRLKWRHSTCLT